MCGGGGAEAKHNNNKQKLGSALLVQKIHLHVLLFGVSSFFHLYMHFILVEYYLLISVLCWKLLHLCCLLTHTWREGPVLAQDQKGGNFSTFSTESLALDSQHPRLSILMF